MLNLRRQILHNTFKLFDLMAMIAWFLLGAAVDAYHTGGLTFGDFLSMRIKLHNFGIFFGFLVLWHAIFRACGLYESKRLSGRRRELIDVAKATTLGVVVIAAAAGVFQVRMADPLFLVFFWAGTTATILASRIVLRMLLVQLRRRGRNLRNVIIVGTNPRALKFAAGLESKQELGYRIAGFVDDASARSKALSKSGYRLVADFDTFPSYLRDHVVDEVAVCLPLKSRYSEYLQVIAACEKHGIVVRIPADFFDLKLSRSKVEHIEADPIVTIYTGATPGLPLLLKRAIDVCLSLILLVLASPFLAVTALLIKAGSSGPVFFAQDRIGVSKRRFKLYKFRTMVPDAEKKLHELEHLNEVDGPAFKIKNDPRITAIGRILRKTSIDELPQLINVLKGDMSLVGPRPLPVRDYEAFDEDWHRRRFSVRPGITCLWQCNGRSNVSFDHWMQLDMQYIDEWSLGLDLKILVMTIPAVLKGSGAA
jgi:exopolysaccharide biosynthesis polyprenyl glycosylphosphotransferase